MGENSAVAVESPIIFHNDRIYGFDSALAGFLNDCKIQVGLVCKGTRYFRVGTVGPEYSIKIGPAVQHSQVI
jgi:hypothetical protein